MPVFHTKTIESILEPVAQQVIKMLENLFHCRFEIVTELPVSSRNSPKPFSEFRGILYVNLLRKFIYK